MPVVAASTSARRQFGGAVNVMDFGARGDGVNDDRPAIQGALTRAAALGQAVYLPAASTRYRITSSLSVGNGVAGILGDGALSLVYTEASDGLGFSLSGVNDILLRDFAVSGNQGSRLASSVGVYGQNCNRLVVRGLTVNGGVSAGILLADCNQVVIDGCVIRNTYADGIHFAGNANAGSSDCLVANCVIEAPGDDGIAYVNYGVGSPPEDPNQFRFRAIGNTVKDGSANGIAVHGGADCLVQGNHVHATGASGVIVDGEGAYVVKSPARVVVSGNTIVNAGITAPSGNHYGVYVNAKANSSAGLNLIVSDNVIQNPRNQGVYGEAQKVSVTGNVINMGSSTSSAIQFGSTAAGSTEPQDIVVSGNRMYNLASSGVVLTCPTGGEVLRAVVSGNVIVEPTGASSDGVQITRGKSIVVAGNVIQDLGSDARSAIYLSSCNTVELGRNLLSGNQTVTLSSCTGVRRDELVVSATPSDTSTYRAGQVAVDTTNNRFAIFNGTSWNVVS